MRVLARARWTNLALVVLAAASVFLLVWSGRTATRADEVRRGHLLPVFHQEEVSRIELRRGNLRSVIVRRSLNSSGTGGASGLDAHHLAEPADPLASDWSLTEPVETDADPVPVEKLLGSLRYATWEREMPPSAPGVDAANTPEALLSEQVLTMAMGDLTFQLRLGQPSVSPPGSHYVEVSGNGEKHTYVVKKSVLDELFVSGDVFRGRQIAPYRKGSTARVVLSSAAGVRRLRRVGADFHFEGMQDEQRARRAEVERIFLALARASADPLLDPEAARTTLSAEASVRVSLTPTAADKPEASLEFGGSCPSDPEKAIAVRSLPEPLAGCVERSVLHALREPASSLIDTSLFALRADEVEVIQIVEGERVLDFAREGEGFVLRQPRSSPLDVEAAKDRLSRLLGIGGTLLPAREEPAKAAEMNAAVVTLESSARPGAERTRETVRAGPPRTDGTRLVYREADGAVLLVPREESFALRADATLLKEHRIFDYPLSAVRGIDIRRGTFKQVIQRNPQGGLHLLEPKGFEVDGGLAIELIDQLRTLRALRWVSDSSTAGFGLEKPRLSVRLQVEVDGKAIERTLLLGRAGPGGYYASVDRDPGVFVAPRALDRSLTNLPIDRSVFAAERSSIVEIALTQGDRGKILLKRIAGELTVQKGTSSSFDPERIDELLDAIETLRPEAVVHTGPATPGEGLRKPLLSVYVRRQSPESVGMPPIRFSVGSRDVVQDASVFYARHASVNATYALPRAQVQRLLDLF
ncbi:MAG: hypothetical protein RL685_2492 [Pseudomonadota bacterium]|jgi:hypothetical protein